MSSLLPAGRQKLAVMGNLGYLLGIAEGPPARRRREIFGRFWPSQRKKKRQRRPEGAKTAKFFFACGAGWGAFGGARLPISWPTLAARAGFRLQSQCVWYRFRLAKPTERSLFEVAGLLWFR